MKNLFPLLLCVCVCACTRNVVITDDDEESIEEKAEEKNEKLFTFTIKGDFDVPEWRTMRTGYLDADGFDMTHLWCIDYYEGKPHGGFTQRPTDPTWGVPRINLPYGHHTLFFVASRGEDPEYDYPNHIITWRIPRDTFWTRYDVDVKSTSNGSRAVELHRVACKLKLQITDAIPPECATITIKPFSWYYGIDLVTGNGVCAEYKPVVFEIPSVYAGKKEVALSVYGLCPEDTWNTGLEILAVNKENELLGYSGSNPIPFYKNTVTNFIGTLFSTPYVDVDIDDEWNEPIEIEF